MATKSQAAVILSVRVSPQTRHQLEDLAQATERSISYLTAEALEQYLAVQAWQIKGLAEAVKEADSPNAKFVPHEEMVAWLKSWGSKNEQLAPKARKRVKGSLAK